MSNVYRMLDPRFTANRYASTGSGSSRLSIPHQEGFRKKILQISSTEFVNFALPSCITIILQPRQVLSSAAKHWDRGFESNSGN